MNSNKKDIITKLIGREIVIVSEDDLLSFNIYRKDKTEAVPFPNKEVVKDKDIIGEIESDVEIIRFYLKETPHSERNNLFPNKYYLSQTEREFKNDKGEKEFIITYYHIGNDLYFLKEFLNEKRELIKEYRYFKGDYGINKLIKYNIDCNLNSVFLECIFILKCSETNRIMNVEYFTGIDDNGFLLSVNLKDLLKLIEKLFPEKEIRNIDKESFTNIRKILSEDEIKLVEIMYS